MENKTDLNVFSAASIPLCFPSVPLPPLPPLLCSHVLPLYALPQSGNEVESVVCSTHIFVGIRSLKYIDVEGR